MFSVLVGSGMGFHIIENFLRFHLASTCRHAFIDGEESRHSFHWKWQALLQSQRGGGG